MSKYIKNGRDTKFKKGEHRNSKTEFRKGQAPWNKGLKGFLAGEKHSRWKGGKNIRNNIHKSEEYILWRSKVFERDNWTCQTCGIRGVYLEAHHRISFIQIIKDNKITNIEDARKCLLLWDISNGVTLCSDCHKLTKGWRKNG